MIFQMNNWINHNDSFKYSKLSILLSIINDIILKIKVLLSYSLFFILKSLSYKIETISIY